MAEGYHIKCITVSACGDKHNPHRCHIEIMVIKLIVVVIIYLYHVNVLVGYYGSVIVIPLSVHPGGGDFHVWLF